MQRAMRPDGYAASLFQTSTPQDSASAAILRHKKGLHIGFGFAASQHILPPHALTHYEGVAISPSGTILAVASAMADEVCLFRRDADGTFNPNPYCVVGGPKAELEFPHDVAFADIDGVEILAITQRRGVISLFKPCPTTLIYNSTPIFQIIGPSSGLSYSDGVSFVGPNGAYLAAANLSRNCITFYQRLSGPNLTYGQTPVYELHHKRIFRPDGLAFSACGTWLAVANHGHHSVAIFRRQTNLPGYGPNPVQVIRRAGLIHPHSLAFTPKSGHLLVSNSGANHVAVFEHKNGWFGPRWTKSTLSNNEFAPADIFAEVNTANRQEGGSKGLAIGQNVVAVSSPEMGIKLYPFVE